MAKRLNKRANKKSSTKRTRKTKVKKLKQITKKIEYMDLEKIYTHINDAQIRRVEQYLVIDPLDAPVVENILKDLNMQYKKAIKIDHVQYVVQPPPEEKLTEEDFDFDDDHNDEIQDDEQCF